MQGMKVGKTMMCGKVGMAFGVRDCIAQLKRLTKFE